MSANDRDGGRDDRRGERYPRSGGARDGRSGGPRGGAGGRSGGGARGGGAGGRGYQGGGSGRGYQGGGAGRGYQGGGSGRGYQGGRRSDRREGEQQGEGREGRERYGRPPRRDGDGDAGGYGGRERRSYGDRDRGGYGDRDRSGGGYRGGDGDRGGYRGGDGDRGGYRGGDRDRGGYGDRPRGGYGDRPRGGRDADRGGPRSAPPRTSGRPPARRRWEEPGISGDEGAFDPERSGSISRAASTGRNLWNPRPPGARRPASRTGAPADRAAAARSAGARRSTNTVGGEQVEGRQAVRELLAAGKRRVSEVWLVEGSDPAPILGEIDNLARKNHVPVRMVSPRRLETVQRTETPQGVVAFADPLESHDLTELVQGTSAGLTAQPEADTDQTEAEADAETDAEADAEAAATTAVGTAVGRRAAFLVVVDGVTDPHNLGAILRSAECAGATGAVLPRHRAVHVTAAVTKAAAGAVEHLPIALVAGVPSALQELEKLGVRTIGLDERGDTSVFDLDLGDEPVALVLGAEGRGLSPLSRRRCERLASIPLYGDIPSLNVSTAAAIACYEVARGRQQAGD